MSVFAGKMGRMATMSNTHFVASMPFDCSSRYMEYLARRRGGVKGDPPPPTAIAA